MRDRTKRKGRLGGPAKERFIRPKTLSADA